MGQRKHSVSRKMGRQKSPTLSSEKTDKSHEDGEQVDIITSNRTCLTGIHKTLYPTRAEITPFRGSAKHRTRQTTSWAIKQTSVNLKDRQTVFFDHKTE